MVDYMFIEIINSDVGDWFVVGEMGMIEIFDEGVLEILILEVEELLLEGGVDEFYEFFEGEEL